MKTYWPTLFVAAGLLLMLAGYAYAVLFAGIPYPDPTAEMLANFNRRSKIAATIGWLGLAAFLSGIVGGWVRSVVGRSRKKSGQ